MSCKVFFNHFIIEHRSRFVSVVVLFHANCECRDVQFIRVLDQ